MPLTWGTAWLKECALRFMVSEALRSLPNETGGVLMGYWGRGSERNEVVITHALGPGPRAKHRKYSFIPDGDYHLNQISRVYELSGRKHTYLGDWHVHPDTTLPQLSKQDRDTLKTIAKSVEARANNPIMLIVGIDGEMRTVKVWKGSSRQILGLNIGRKTVPLKVLIC